MDFVLGCIYLIVTCAVLASMELLCIKGDKSKATKFFIACHGMVAIWCSSQLMLLFCNNSLELTITYLYGNIGICFSAACWYGFSVLHTGGSLNGIKLYLPAAVSIFHYIAVITNRFHSLYYKEFTVANVVHGPLFYTNVIATYFLVITGATILFMKSKSVAKLLVIISVLCPVVFNIIFLSGIIKSEYDITPLGLAITVWLTMFATVKYQFIDLKKELAITNEKLLLEKERNRIAQTVHDTVGHTLTMVQSYIKLIDISVENGEYDNTKIYVNDARHLTQKGIKELRESINQLREESQKELISQGLTQLANQVKEIPVEITIKGEESTKFSHLYRPIYDSVREAITNSLKYASANKIEIILRFDANAIEVVIGDDGVGCEEIHDNNGIRGIKERIQGVNGSVRIISAANEGFLIRIRIPVA